MGSICSNSIFPPCNPSCPQTSMKTPHFYYSGQTGECSWWLLGGSDWAMSGMLTVNSQPRRTCWCRGVLPLVAMGSGLSTTGRATTRVPVPSPSRVCSNTQRIHRFQGLALGGRRCLRMAESPPSNGRGGSGGGNAQKERNEAGISIQS